jgi:hypothetical protein
MGLAIPITNGHVQAGAQVFAGSGSPEAAPPQVPGSSAADVQGTGALSGTHNTPMHVGGLLLFAGAVIFGLHYLGFRVAFDVGMGRG